MDKEFVRSFMLKNGKYFPRKKIIELSNEIEKSNKNEYSITISYRNPTLFTLLYWFLPLFWWLDRFFVKDIYGGLIKGIAYPLLGYLSFEIAKELPTHDTYGLFVMYVIFAWFGWVLIDGFTIYTRVKKLNYCKIKTVIGKRIVATKLGVLPTLMLILSLGVFLWGIGIQHDNIENSKIIEITKTDTIGNNKSFANENELQNVENIDNDEQYYSDLFYEEQTYLEEQPSSSVSPLEDREPITDVFSDKNVVEEHYTKGYGKGEEIGVVSSFNYVKRKIIFEPEILEYYTPLVAIKLLLYVDKKGNVKKVKKVNNNIYYTAKQEKLALQHAKEVKFEKVPSLKQNYYESEGWVKYIFKFPTNRKVVFMPTIDCFYKSKIKLNLTVDKKGNVYKVKILNLYGEKINKEQRKCIKKNALNILFTPSSKEKEIITKEFNL